jgi:hypothetical protein
MISIRCKDCNKELVGYTNKTVSCGCPNMATIDGDKIFAVDLSHIIMLNSYAPKKSSGVLTYEDTLWQEQRKNRKIRKLDFEVR